MATQDAAIQALAGAIRASQWMGYLSVAGSALVAVDFLHTFPDEVKHMWSGPRTFLKAMFFLIRYGLFPYNAFSAYYGFKEGLSVEECKAACWRISLSTNILIACCEVILMFRVYAFSGRKKRVAVLLVILAAVSQAVVFYLMVKFMNSLKYIDMGPRKSVCAPVEARIEFLGASFVVLLVGVFVTMVVMVYFAHTKHHSIRNIRSHVFTTFYGDGIIYFIVLTVLATANAVVAFAAPEGYKLLLMKIEVDIQAILCTRMLLHLRKSATRDNVLTGGNNQIGSYERGSWYSGREMSAMHFQQGVVVSVPMETLDRSVLSSSKT